MYTYIYIQYIYHIHSCRPSNTQTLQHTGISSTDPSASHICVVMCVFVRLCVCLNSSVGVCVRVYMCTRINIHAYEYAHTFNVDTIHTCLSLHRHTNTLQHTIDPLTRTHTHTHTHTHTNTHTHTHTYTQVPFSHPPGHATYI